MANLDPRVSQTAAVAQRVELQAITLLSVHADLSEELEVSQFAAFTADLATDVHHRVGDDWCSYVVSFRLLARGVRPGTDAELDADVGDAPEDGEEDSADVLYMLNATYRADYSLSEPAGPETEQYEAFGQVSAASSAYPYARELIQTLTGRAGLPPLTLGLVRSPLELLRPSEPDSGEAE